MSLHWLDWVIISLFIACSLAIGFAYRKVASGGLQGYFLGGRNMPWYLAGLSMVATTFAADTPLAVTELVAQGGIAKNWLWWNLLAGGMLTTIFFARLWKKSGVLTEVEFIEMRYSGVGARFLRGFKAIYLGLFINAMIIGWVNQAFITLIQVFFGIPGSEAIWYLCAAMLFIVMYSSLSGLKGIAVTDAFQFIIAMLGCIVLAVLVLNSERIGGVAGLRGKLPESAFRFFPVIGVSNAISGFGMSVATFLTYAGVLWWSSWYPGAEPGGGGYIAQRMMGTKDEKNAVYATLFFQIAHYCLRPWPWIIVALAALVLYPDLGLADQKLGYVLAMKEFLPAGLRGLMLVAFLGAYMSTISTQLNWGASYLVNDLYKPFLEKKWFAGDSVKRDIMVSRLMTVFLGIAGVYITTFITTITGVWEFIFQCGAGLGLVLIVRWFWHRVNVWAEIAGTLAPFAVYGVLYILRSRFNEGAGIADPAKLAELQQTVWYFDFGYSVLLSVFCTTVCWILVAYITPKTDPVKLSQFFKKVQPPGHWSTYGKVDNSAVWPMLGAWVTAVIMVYALLFATGKLILFGLADALIYLVAGMVSFLLFRIFARKAKLFD